MRTPSLLLPTASLLAFVACSEPAPTAPVAPVDVPACDDGLWCWLRGAPVIAVSGSDADHVVAVGVEGHFATWEDGAWVDHRVPTMNAIVSGVRVSEDTLWAADSEGALWRSTGGIWREDGVVGEVIGVVQVTADGTLWALGSSAEAHGGSTASAAWRRDGAQWVHYVNVREYCIGGSLFPVSADQVLAVGLSCVDEVIDSAQVHSFDGADWQQMGEGITDQSWFPTLSFKGGELVLGASFVDYVWDGGAWKSYAAPDNPHGFDGVWDGWAFTKKPDGVCDQMLRHGEQVWCFGGPQVHHKWDDDEWQDTIVDVFEPGLPAEAWGTMPPTVWAGSDARYAWGSGPDDVYRARVSTEYALEHFDGTTWKQVHDGPVIALTGAQTTANVLTVDGTMAYVSGEQQRLTPLPNGEAEPWNLSAYTLPNGQVLVGIDSQLVSRDADGWSVHYELPESNWRVQQIVGNAADDVWLIREVPGRPYSYALDHFDGATWTERQTWQNAQGRLAVDGEETWFYGPVPSEDMWNTEAGLQRLSTPAEDLGMRWAPIGGELWVSDEAVWVSTPSQTVFQRWAE